MTMRHAIYFAPAVDHPLWAAGCDWLGRDPRTGQPLNPPAREHVHAPRRYGFHATLKAPMRLAHGVSQSRLTQSLKALARRHAPFHMPRLEVALLDDFLALRPASDAGTPLTLQALADDCVLALDELRAPLSELELARQLKPALTPRQREQVQRLGYAHVLEDWRFHMTLSDGLRDLPGPAAAELALAARRHFDPALARPLRCEDLCLFTEPGPGLPFELSLRLPLGGD